MSVSVTDLIGKSKEEMLDLTDAIRRSMHLCDEQFIDPGSVAAKQFIAWKQRQLKDTRESYVGIDLKQAPDAIVAQLAKMQGTELAQIDDLSFLENKDSIKQDYRESLAVCDAYLLELENESLAERGAQDEE